MKTLLIIYLIAIAIAIPENQSLEACLEPECTPLDHMRRFPDRNPKKYWQCRFLDNEEKSVLLNCPRDQLFINSQKGCGEPCEWEELCADEEYTGTTPCVIPEAFNRFEVTQAMSETTTPLPGSERCPAPDCNIASNRGRRFLHPNPQYYYLCHQDCDGQTILVVMGCYTRPGPGPGPPGTLYYFDPFDYYCVTFDEWIDYCNA